MILPFIFYKYYGKKPDIDMCNFEKCRGETIVWIGCCDTIHSDFELDADDTYEDGAGAVHTATYWKPDIDLVLEEHVFSGPKGEQRAIEFVKRWWAENDPLQKTSEYQGAPKDRGEGSLLEAEQSGRPDQSRKPKLGIVDQDRNGDTDV